MRWFTNPNAGRNFFVGSLLVVFLCFTFLTWGSDTAPKQSAAAVPASVSFKPAQEEAMANPGAFLPRPPVASMPLADLEGLQSRIAALESENELLRDEKEELEATFHAAEQELAVCREEQVKPHAREFVEALVAERTISEGDGVSLHRFFVRLGDIPRDIRGDNAKAKELAVAVKEFYAAYDNWKSQLAKDGQADYVERELLFSGFRERLSTILYPDGPHWAGRFFGE